jgi:tRNA U34 5-methylaminomethyl-2-thiouridine-forming methyltransferase MnmC
LNALLTYFAAWEADKTVFIHAVELYPLHKKEYGMLNYGKLLPYADADAVFNQLHNLPWDQVCNLNNYFTIFKNHISVEKMCLSDDTFNLVYFDAFSPAMQPQMWTQNIFAKIYQSLQSGGILLTYSTKGDVKRTLKSVGFQLTKLPGPIGKREILQAKK